MATSSTTSNGLDSAILAIESASSGLETVTFYQLPDVSDTSCFKDTEESLNINIPGLRKSDNSLIKLIQALGYAAELKSLDFNRVKWSIPEVKELCGVIKQSSNLRRVSFQQSYLSSDGLKLLAETLKKNRVLQELSFSESKIEQSGACAIAAALRINESLQELQIWEDSIGSRGAEELAKMIEANATLKSLIIFDVQPITAYPLVSAALGRNRNLVLHLWCRERKDKQTKVAELVPSNKTLRLYGIDSSGCYRVICALAQNVTVESMDLSGNHVNSKCAKELGRVLKENRALKHLNLSNTGISSNGAYYIAASLFSNNSLQSLQLEGNPIGGDGIDHALCPLSKFKPGQQQANFSLKVLSVGGPQNKMGSAGANAIVRMISTNQSLLKFSILGDQSMGPSEIVKILAALQRNTALKCLSLKGCKGVAGDAVFEAVVEVLQVNPWMEQIDLTATPIQASGKADHLHQRLRQNTAADQQIDYFKDMPTTIPKSARAFLCGQEFAGKTTLCNSIMQSVVRARLPTIEQIKTFVNPSETVGRTQGIKIKVLEDENTRISIWDLAGQHVFHAFHDLMFPGQGSPSFFLLVCSLFRKPENKEPKRAQEIEEDILYWLKFITSNSRRAEALLAHVTVVFTHIDKTSETSDLYLSAIQCVYRLRDRFRGFVELSPTIFTVDARSSGSVSKVCRHVQQTAKTILERVPRIYQVCEDLRALLLKWRSENSNKPVMRWNDFCELCQLKVPPLRIQSRHDDPREVENRRRAAARSLHTTGDIIYFDDLDIIVINCEWFCEEVLGRLVTINGKNQNVENMQNRGFTTRNELEAILKEALQGSGVGFGPRILENVQPSDVVSMMLKLELCFEQNPGASDTKLFIPAILEEGRFKTQRWELGGNDCIYTGRHLECDDSSHTFLPPGFFPRLQVHMYNKFLASAGNRWYRLEKNLISMVTNGVEFRIELGGDMGYFIDVLACSSQDINETLKLLNHLVIQNIQRLCSSSWGGFLVEGIVRPTCIQNLIPPRYRRDQIVPVEHLKQQLLSVTADSMYNYQHTWNAISEGRSLILPSGFDYARDLLGEDDFRDVLQRRYHDLYRLAVTLDVPQEASENNEEEEEDEEEEDEQENNEGGSVSPTMCGIAKGVEKVLQRLRIIEQELRDIKHEIQGLRYYEHSLLTELHRKLQSLANYSVDVEEKRVPHMFYLVSNERRLITQLLPGMAALQLHLLCEYRREMHVVEGQPGCNVVRIDNATVQSILPYLGGFVKMLTFALKVGAHAVAGMGELIPDLSREVAKLADAAMLGGGDHHHHRGLGPAASSRSVGHVDALRAPEARDMRPAQQWLVDFLRARNCVTGKAIAQRFWLWRVRYTDDGRVAWLCQRHKLYAIQIGEAVELPIA